MYAPETVLQRRIGTIHSGGHSLANSQKKACLVRLFGMTYIRISLSCRNKIPTNQSAFEYSTSDIYRPANLMSNFDSTSRNIQQTEMDDILIVHSIMHNACFVLPYDVGDHGCSRV
ncbi:hypothetical protein TNCV_4881431 [Trichonephila clavipes]|nr:hypothetical protein TNCV_4881431 [Trichonephila clavipes]